MRERPVHGSFVVQRVAVSPTKITLRSLRDYAQPIVLTALTGDSTVATNLRVAYEPGDQPLAALPAGVNVAFGSAVSLGPRETKPLTVTVTGDSRSAEAGALVLRVVSDELGSEPVTLVRVEYRFYDQDSQAPDIGPALFPTPSYVETSTPRGASVTEQIALESGYPPYDSEQVLAAMVAITFLLNRAYDAPSSVPVASPQEPSTAMPAVQAQPPRTLARSPVQLIQTC